MDAIAAYDLIDPGELAALATAGCWTLTALAFEFAGKRVGSLSVNLIRLVFGFVFLVMISELRRGMAFPTSMRDLRFI